MIHAAPARFFIRAENDSDTAAHGNAGCLDCGKCINRTHGGTFVVHCASAVNPAVRNFRSIGRMNPAFALGNNVNMRNNAEHLFSAAVVYAARVAVKIRGFKAE